jgi:hypothetical protein
MSDLQSRLPSAMAQAARHGMTQPHNPTPSLQGPSVQPDPPDTGKTDGSPSAVRAAEVALIGRHTHLKAALPALEAGAARSQSELRAAKAEILDIVRLLAAHKRLREPRKRQSK